MNVHLSAAMALPPAELGAECVFAHYRVSTTPWGGGVGYIPFDGVVMDTGTLPGAWYGGYNMGMNLVHEAGHW